MSICGCFNDIGFDRMEEYLAKLSACPYVTSDYSFVNLYGWAAHYGLKWCFEGNLAWIRQTAGEEVFWAPAGDWAGVDWAALRCLDKPMRFTRVPEPLVEIWKGVFGARVAATEVRDHFDYVYSVKELVELAGARFHKKKNLLRQFEKGYDFQYVPLGDACVHEVLAMQKEWLSWQEEPSKALEAENEAIHRVLCASERLNGLVGGVIRVEGRVVAYTVGERLTDDTIVIHFEKGDTRYKGIYQAISQHFLDTQADRFQFVNREQDLGDEGLRKAKQSYNPVKFMRKYEVMLT
jgi:hypothetical protein